MIRLHTQPDVECTCPHCRIRLDVRGWYIPGMRSLADLVCSRCGREYYADLPSGHALYIPALVDKASGKVYEIDGALLPQAHDRLVMWLKSTYGGRTDQPVDLVVEEFRPVRQPVLLNCLDFLYGHVLLKLLNAQYYLDHRPDLDLIVLVPRILRWMVPEGVAAIWTVDWPLSRGLEWNDWLGREIRQQLAAFEACWLSVGFSHPHPEDFDIERFTRVKPFPLDEWEPRLERPTVTFIWRDDRLWYKTVYLMPGIAGRIRLRVVNTLRRKRILAPQPVLSEPEVQRAHVVELAEGLSKQIPNLDFAVVGLGEPGGLPDTIDDQRSQHVDEAVERAWCERYASSHLVIGIHGSNMLLPSAHAGAVIELVQPERWGNIVQDLLPKPSDMREGLFRYRLLPDVTPARIVAQCAASLLESHFVMVVTMRREFCDHAGLDKAGRWSQAYSAHLPHLPR